MNAEILIGIVILLFGAAVGAALAWLLLKTKAGAVTAAELATLKERLAGKETELQKLHEAQLREVADHKQVRVENAQLQAELQGERRAAQERISSFNRATEELAERFKALSRDALKDNNQSFLQLAHATLEKFQENAKGDLEFRQKAIDQLVKPLKESLEKVDGKIGEIEKERAGAYSELRQQVKALATSQLQLQAETGNLVKALRTPHIRGRWGEIQLRRVVEMAGMLQYCDFVEQETVVTEDGRIRPDLIVRLPGNRTIVVDAKVPFDAFYESISTTDDDVRSARLKDHARLVRVHIGALSKKSYWESVQPTPEFVLLFLPGETFYSAALENDPKLIEDGVGQNVIIATPTTLIALLKAVSYGWRQEQMAENAKEVSELGKTLYDRLRVFTNHFANIGKGIERALDSYNQGVGSFEGRVLRTARKFKERGALSGEEIEVLEPIDKAIRSLSLDEGGLFPDLVAADEIAAPDVMDDDSLPLLSSKSATSGEK
ncbi:MAG TPA: DNA recombination protein RmuC [Pyrinomonadaceae bacterium]|nr:DNA recombination protein RmuC [Pyrinomonadaceae bacterium]